MYCRNCGKELEAKDNFCSSCGFEQKNQNRSLKLIIDLEKLKSLLDKTLTKGWQKVYLAWALLNTPIFLWSLTLTHDYYESKYFFPFGKDSTLEDYDWTEYFTYLILPLLILFFYNNFIKDSSNIPLEKRYDLSVKKDKTAILTGIALLIIIITVNILIQLGILDKADKSLFNMLLLAIRIAVTVWIVDIAKKLNRNTIVWGIFGFILPPIALIFIGSKRKFNEQTPLES